VPKKAVLSAAVTGLVAQTLPALAVVRAPPRENQPSENHAKNRVEKFTPLTTLPFRFIQVDERLNGDGTGLILGINDELLGFILLTIPAVIFSQFFYAQKDEGIAAGGEDDDSGLSL
jgi:photosystem II PsbW protein